MAQSRKKWNATCTVFTVLIITIVIGLGIVSIKFADYQKASASNELLVEKNEEIRSLKKQLEEKVTEIEQKETRIQQLEDNQSTPYAYDEFIQALFHPDGRQYVVRSGNIAFYKNAELNERITESNVYFTSEEVIPVYPQSGIESYAYWTNIGLVYSSHRTTLDVLQEQ